jgi:hypothetical protein|nr:hypothetical protein [Burkholderia sp.]
MDKSIIPRAFILKTLSGSTAPSLERDTPLRDFFPRDLTTSETATHVPSTSLHMLR